ncbi:MAG TPA: lamin tail domain-containing protein [Bacteroidales bacterium]|nr:lamin tail domain-containing protein [Bacteroidales bacterium]HQI45959.1 lamin tail domain-containing protein [Bacteroidales bacterium]
MRNNTLLLRRLCCILFFLFICLQSKSQNKDTLVQWTFATGTVLDSIADKGIPENQKSIIRTYGETNELSYTVNGYTTKSAGCSGWNNGSALKYWQVIFSTKGYNKLDLKSRQRSSNTGPKNFIIQYKTSLLNNWLNISTDTIHPAVNWTSAMVDLPLPAYLNNQDSIYLRWVMTNNEAVNGSEVSSVGTSNIDDIIIIGQANSETLKPQVIKTYLKNLSQIIVIFNKAVNQTAEVTDNYSGVNNISGTIFCETKDTITLCLSSPLNDGTTYTLTISNIQDINGVTMESPQSFSLSYSTYLAPLVITEIMYNPPESGTDSLEFIEILNNGNIPVALKNYTFMDGNDTYTFMDDTIHAYQYYLIAFDSLKFKNFYKKTARQWNFGGLSNTGNTFILKNASAVVLDSVVYSSSNAWPSTANGFGASLTLCNPSADNALNINWTNSTEFIDSVNHIAVFASPGNGCMTTETKEKEKRDLFINCFPNPAKDKINVQIKDEATSLIIYDIFGKIYFKLNEPSKNTIIDTELWTNGIYYFHILFKNNMVITKKIIIL